MRAFVRAFFTLIGFAVLSLAFLSDETLISQLIAGGILIIGIFISAYVYRIVLKRPAADLSRYATPDLDNLIPAPGSGISVLTAQQLSNVYISDKWKLNKGELKIWGDWQEKSLNKIKTINGINYNQGLKKLEIEFDTGQLELINPDTIHLTSTYLKILFADKVLWNWNNNSSIIYHKEDNIIHRKSNIELDLDELDIDSTQPAMMFN